MILGFVLGVYATISLILAVWFYYDEGPSFTEEPPRKWKVIQAFVLGLFWPIIVPSVLAEEVVA